MLKKMSSLKYPKKILFAIIIGLAVVSFWRGAWQLMDLYFFPSNYILSNWTSLILGAIILITTHYVIKELM